MASVSVLKYFTRLETAIMIDDRKGLPSTETESDFPLPARFDESAVQTLNRCNRYPNVEVVFGFNERVLSGKCSQGERKD